MGLGIRMTDPAEAVASPTVPRIMERYQNAYRVAGTACGMGTAAKAIGVIAGIVVFLGGLAVSVGAHSQAGFMAGLVIAAVIVALFWILGTLVSAIGENLMAVLDTAVYSSTLLNNAERAKIMSLG